MLVLNVEGGRCLMSSYEENKQCQDELSGLQELFPSLSLSWKVGSHVTIDASELLRLFEPQV